MNRKRIASGIVGWAAAGAVLAALAAAAEPPNGRELVRPANVFLHRIQVGDPILETMGASRMSATESWVTLAFSAGPRACAISLNKAGEVGRRIRIEEGGAVLVDKDLARNVRHQTGLALEN